MTLYRKRPVTVEAVKWTGDPADAGLLDLIGKSKGDVIVDSSHDSAHAYARAYRLSVTTVDGNRVAVPVGAYLVLDGKGWPYPCDAELFEAGHDEVAADGDALTVLCGTDGDWYWHRKAPNGETIGQGEGYTRRGDAVIGALRANPDLDTIHGD